MRVQLRRGRLVLGAAGLAALLSVLAFAAAGDRAPGLAQVNDDDPGPGPFRLFLPNVTSSEGLPDVIDSGIWPESPALSGDGRLACAPLGEVCTGPGCSVAGSDNGAPVPLYNFDPEQGRRLLVDAGWRTDGDGVAIEPVESFFVFTGSAGSEVQSTAMFPGLPVPGEQPGDWGADGVFRFVADVQLPSLFTDIEELEGAMCVRMGDPGALSGIGAGVVLPGEPVPTPTPTDIDDLWDLYLQNQTGDPVVNSRVFTFLPPGNNVSPGFGSAGHIGGAGLVAGESEAVRTLPPIVRPEGVARAGDILIAAGFETGPDFPATPEAEPLGFFETGPGQLELAFEITTPLLIENPVLDVTLGEFGTAPLPLPLAFLPGARHYGTVLVGEEFEVALDEVVLHLRDWNEPATIPPFAQVVAGPPVVAMGNSADETTMRFDVFNPGDAAVDLGQTTWTSSCFDSRGVFVGYWLTQGQGTLGPGSRATLQSGNQPVRLVPPPEPPVLAVDGLFPELPASDEFVICNSPIPDLRPG